MTPLFRVLVVEDSPGDAELIAIALAESPRVKFHVSFAGTLAQAREHILSGAVTDVILLDLSLPDVIGETTVVRMREAAPSLPIIIMTGLDDVLFGERTVALGAQDYLVKGDFTGPMLWRAISYAVKRMNLGMEREALVTELRAAVDMKNKMFGILAHDLRNPIGAVCGYAEFLEMTEEKNLSEVTMKSLAAIRESATYMNDLIEEVLAMAVADGGAVKIIRQWIDLAALARKAVAVCAVAAAKKRVLLAVDAQQVWAEGDAVKLEQVLNNLIGNAIKFAPADDVVTVAVAEGDGCKRLSVTDHGGGIAPDVLSHLFEPLIKGKTGTAGERSNGLGLYICSRIVEAHGGSIAVDTEVGRGTTMIVVLPDPPREGPGDQAKRG